MYSRVGQAWGVLGAIIAFGLIASLVHGNGAPRDPDPVLPKDALDIGTEAYIFGYPLVTMEMTRRVMTNVETPDGAHAPMGQFANVREYPDATFHDVPTPNADTLYSVAWLDLTREPYIFNVPDSHDRYYLMPMLDGWTDVFQVPGKRTTGTKAQKYAITGPGWRGTLPPGVTEYKSPTNMVWIIGRTYCTGTPTDYQEVHAFQDQLSLVPLSSYGKPYTPAPGRVDPAIDMRTPVRDQVRRMGAVEYFGLLAELMKDNPPAAADAPIVARMAKIGIVPGQAFDISRLDPVVAASLEDVPKTALARIAVQRRTAGRHMDGWSVPQVVGVYGTDYLQRAAIAAFGLGANRLEDAVYSFSDTDAQGKPYNGAHRYVLHFRKGELPPVNAFWSLTMYNDQLFFVDNPLNRYTLSQRNNLKFNRDGSLDLYLQAENPGPAKADNWLPAPKDTFVLALRLYWPKESPPTILDGSWQPPAVTKVE
jgi:hypothetical protein